MVFESIHNYYEQLVVDTVSRLAEQIDKAPTDEHLEDIACVALNHLPPRYVRHSVDFLSHLTSAQREEMQKQVDEAIRQAVEVVRRRRHESTRETD